MRAGHFDCRVFGALEALRATAQGDCWAAGVVGAKRSRDRRVKSVVFDEPKTLEDFDWQFNPCVKKKQFFALATCRFIRDGRDVLLSEPPGTGKSHLVQGLGYHAIKAGYAVSLHF